MTPSPHPKGRIAWGISPHLGGTTTVYRVLGTGLRLCGWEVIGVAAGAQGSGDYDPMFDDGFCRVLLPNCTDIRRCAAEFVRWVDREKIDLLLCTDQAFMVVAIPALPPGVRVVTRCGSMTRHTYALATANLDRTEMLVLETRRQYEDLTRHWGVPREKCAIITGGVETDLFAPLCSRCFDGPLRLVYVGRLNDVDKGVMLLPRITRRLVTAGVKFHLDILGSGPCADLLNTSFAHFRSADYVTFHGCLRREEVAEHLRKAHVSLVTSRFEAAPRALLEAMACGCVPVASRIEEATDTVITQGMNGWLCKVGSASDFAEAILDLDSDRKRLEAMSIVARQTSLELFTAERAVKEYDAVFMKVVSTPPPSVLPVPILSLEIPGGIRPTWRRFVPQPFKNYIRTWAERFHRTI